MAENELSLNLNVQKDIDELKRFQQELKNTKAMAADAVAAFRGGTGSAADARQAINVAAQAGTGGVQSSATSSTSGGATPASAMAAASVQGRPADVAAYNAAVRQLPGLSTGAYRQIADQFGVTVGAAPPAQPFNTTQAQVTLAQTAMNSTAQFTRTMALPTMGMPAQPGYPTMQMPAWSAPFPPSAPSTQSAVQMQVATQQMSPMQLPGWGYGYRAPFQPSPLTQRIAGVGVYGAASALSNSAAMTVSGSPNIMGNAQTAGQLVGGLLGSFGGPATAVAGALIGGSVAEWVAAPMERDRQVMASLWPVAGAFDFNVQSRMDWANSRAEYFRAGSNMRTFSAGAVGAMYSSAVSSLFTGGFNPTSPNGAYPLFRPPLPPGSRESGGGAGGMIAGLGRQTANGIRLIQDIGASKEDLAQSVVRRIGMRYPDESAATEVMNRIAPIWGSAPENGLNIADILVKHGPLDTFRFLQSQVDPGQLEAVPRDVLGNASASFRRAGRELGFAGLMARGSGTASMMAFRRQMGVLGELPGGRESMAYAQAQAGYRDAGALAFEQSSMVNFGIPQAQIGGALAVADVIPYAPGQRIGLQAASIRNQRAQAVRIQQYMSQRRDAGMLSESEELSLTQQLAGLQAGVASGIANIADGAANILPGLSAHMPAGMSRFTSLQQGALMMGGYNPFRRTSGAWNGRAASIQESLYRDLGVPTGPYSRSEGVNQFGGRAEALLERIANAMDRMAGNGKGSFSSGGGSGSNSDQDGMRWRENFN